MTGATGVHHFCATSEVLIHFLARLGGRMAPGRVLDRWRTTAFEEPGTAYLTRARPSRCRSIVRHGRATRESDEMMPPTDEASQ